MADVVYDLAVDLGIAFAKLLPALPDALIDLPAFLGGNRSDGRVPDPHDIRLLRPALFSHGSSPRLHSCRSPWASALAGALFLLLLFLLDAFFFVGHCRIGDNADTWRQSLLLAFFFALLDIDIHVVRISPLFFIGAFLLPETTFVDALQIRQFFDEIGVHIGANFFDLHLGGLQ